MNVTARLRDPEHGTSVQKQLATNIDFFFFFLRDSFTINPVCSPVGNRNDKSMIGNRAGSNPTVENHGIPGWRRTCTRNIDSRSARNNSTLQPYDYYRCRYYYYNYYIHIAPPREYVTRLEISKNRLLKSFIVMSPCRPITIVRHVKLSFTLKHDRNP